MVVDIDDRACPGCGHALHQIGEDTSERLDIIPPRVEEILRDRSRALIASASQFGFLLN
jgi:transposase